MGASACSTEISCTFTVLKNQKHINMSKQIIASDPSFKRDVNCDPQFSLKISEFFMDAIQGEGISIGAPAAFLRLQGCTLNCIFCDSKSVWKFGNPYSFGELFDMMEKSGLIERLKNGTHLVLTGGSVLKQEKQIEQFLYAFMIKYKFKPFIEIENECTLMPSTNMVGDLIDQWNNSPKLENSQNKKTVRYKPEILKALSGLSNSWFKFVVTDEASWEEIELDFLEPGLIRREQIILMPEGESRKALEKTRMLTAEIAIREGVRFSDREHVILYDLKTGV